MKPNIYTYRLKRGYETTITGITYNHLKKELTDKFRIDWTSQFEFSYRVWFFENFFTVEAEAVFKSISRGRDLVTTKKMGKMPFEKIIDDKVYLKGESCLKYLDYTELIEARRSSRQALVFSSLSVVLAAVAILVTIILGS